MNAEYVIKSEYAQIPFEVVSARCLSLRIYQQGIIFPIYHVEISQYLNRTSYLAFIRGIFG